MYLDDLNEAVGELGRAMDFGGHLGEDKIAVIKEAAEMIKRLRSREAIVVNCAKAIQMLANGDCPWEFVAGVFSNIVTHLDESVRWLVARDAAMERKSNAHIRALEDELMLYKMAASDMKGIQ